MILKLSPIFHTEVDKINHLRDQSYLDFKILIKQSSRNHRISPLTPSSPETKALVRPALGKQVSIDSDLHFIQLETSYQAMSESKQCTVARKPFQMKEKSPDFNLSRRSLKEKKENKQKLADNDRKINLQVRLRGN